jgi:hypothetical protein
MQSFAQKEVAIDVSSAAEQQHAELVAESGLPESHPAFAKWRLVEGIGHGAFSKV